MLVRFVFRYLIKGILHVALHRAAYGMNPCVARLTASEERSKRLHFLSSVLLRLCRVAKIERKKNGRHQPFLIFLLYQKAKSITFH